MKRCPRCTRSLPDGSYTNDRSSRDGLADRCRECEAIRAKRRWLNMPPEQKEYRRQYFNGEYYPEHKTEIVERVLTNRRRQEDTPATQENT